MSIQQLRERRANLSTQARKLHEDNINDWKPELSAQFDTLMDDIGRLDEQINQFQRAQALDADRQADSNPDMIHDRKDQAKALRNKAWRTFLVNGPAHLSDVERSAIMNTMSTGIGAEGGFTVQTDVAASVLDALRAFGGMREVSQVIRTAQGNPLNYPTTDGTAEVGEIVAENALATDANLTFGSASLNPFKYSSRVVTVPIELLQDSEVDIEALVQRRLVERLGRITNTHFTVGTGTGQPRGVVTASTAGRVGAVGQTLSVTYDDLIWLQHSVNRAYRGNASWMFADTTMRSIRMLKDSQNRPIFVPGYEAGIPAGEPDRLLGAPIVVNDDVAAMAANARSILYGDFSYYLIRDCMDISLLRFTDSAFARRGQVGFLAWLRSGGNFIDASGGAVKHYANSAT